MEGGCECCKKWEEHYYWNHTKRLRFYKIMTGDFSRRMKLPKKFVDRFEGQLSDILDLKGPSGNTWHVGLMKVEGNVFMQSGWKDFVEAHCVEEKDLLVFKYNGHSCFDVLIFEGSGCEKASAYFVKNNSFRKREIGEDSVEILHVSRHQEVLECDSSSDSHGAGPQGSSVSIPHKFPSAKCKAADKTQRVTSSSCKMIPGSEAPCPKKARGQPRKNGESSKGTEYHVKQEHVVMDENKKFTLADLYATAKSRLTEKDEKKVLELVHAIKPDNPFFILLMQPTHIWRRFFVTIPAGFVKAHLPSTSQSIVLQTPDKKRKWSVSYLVQKTVSGFSGKWSRFVYDNDLEVGDICLFELVQIQKGVEMTVYIFRAADKDFSFKRSRTSM